MQLFWYLVKLVDESKLDQPSDSAEPTNLFILI